jgi:hypothetical protein
MLFIGRSSMESKGMAWYDVKGRGWLRDILVLLHPPYTLWHLSYIPIGAALAPRLDWGLLGWTLLAFFLAMGVGGHCLDELNGRPLRTKLPAAILWSSAGLSIAAAIAIGCWIGISESIWAIPCIVFGGFIVFAYNLEWGAGFFHQDYWFGVAWGAFPAVTAYMVQTGVFTLELLLVAITCWALSMAQRKLSLQARFWRRKVEHVEGDFTVVSQGLGPFYHKLTRRDIVGPVEMALKYLNVAVVMLAAGLLLMHGMKGVL